MQGWRYLHFDRVKGLVKNCRVMAKVETVAVLEQGYGWGLVHGLARNK